MKKRSIDDRLLAAQVAISNSQSDTEVRNYLAAFGYDDARLGQGQARYDAALAAQQKQKVEYGDQFAATGQLNSAWTAANVEYMKFVKVARVALKSDVGAFKKLALTGERRKTFSGWLAQAKQFYINALGDADIVARMAQYGMTQEKLQAGQQQVEACETANAAQEKEKGEAQQATLERDRAMDSLDEWMGDFTAIARIALAEKPQLLEKLGIKEPS